MTEINIYYRSSDPIGATLSNLAFTPFCFDGENIASYEAFHQALKYEDLSEQRRILGLFGPAAKQAGRKANKLRSGFVYWQGRVLGWFSVEHQTLLDRALRAKFEGNKEAREALVASGSCLYSHNVPREKRRPAEEYSKTHFCQLLYSIRQELQGESK